MVTEAAIWAALGDVKDPEIPPVSVVDMGLVTRIITDGNRITVELTPTFVGCPALAIIRQNVIDRLLQVDGVAEVAVRFVFDPPWTSERITPQGRERLRSFGIAPPVRESGHLLVLEEVPPCPFCGSGDTHMENLFGPTACRAIYYCDSCRQPFEAMKTV
ncbi:MAG TPA: 1,2-phenylacetyl-CoA epoxidase subunit PaaD [Symbiobacteriaceae bacterium]|nr:1,2-phenylacetyl-CoA epoxidase subunit PaaD [Symbiobacteriaceae bacterium]